MEFYEKLLAICEEKGISPYYVQKSLKLASSSTSYWKRGQAPRIDTLRKISDFLQVPISYFTGTEQRTDYKEPITSQALGSLVMMPVIGSVRAGQGLTAYEEYTGEYIGVPVDSVHNNPQDFRVLSVVGDSMYPIFIEGIDKLVVNVNDFSIDNGAYVVAILKNGDGVIKKLRITEDGSMELISINPMYAPIKQEQIDRIYGVVYRSERVFR